MIRNRRSCLFANYSIEPKGARRAQSRGIQGPLCSYLAPQVFGCFALLRARKLGAGGVQLRGSSKSQVATISIDYRSRDFLLFALADGRMVRTMS